MKIEEIIRSCANEKVAAAAVSSMGRAFSRDVLAAADCYEMSLGGFTAFAVDRFSRRGDEREMRSVASAMASAQEPVLAGLHRILCIALASGVLSNSRQSIESKSCPPANLCSMDGETRREMVY
jgi:hypothetical protein